MGNKGTSSAVIDQPTEDELAKMKPAGKKGWQFRVEAAKKLASRSPMGRESRLEAAAELAEKAATQFKLSKMYDEAGECYQLQADAYMRMKETMQTASALIQAAETYGKHGSAEQAFEVYTSGIEIYKDAGKFDRAGKNQLALANVSFFLSSFVRCLDIFFVFPLVFPFGIFVLFVFCFFLFFFLTFDFFVLLLFFLLLCSSFFLLLNSLML